MRWAILFILVLILSVMQTSLLSPFSIWGVRPDIILVVVVTVALTKGPMTGAVVGLFCGLLVDLIGGHMIGLDAFVKGLVGLVVGVVGGRMFWENAFVPIALVFVASLFNQIVYFIGAKAFGVNFYFASGVIRILLPGTWYNAFTAIALYPLFRRLIYLFDKYVGDNGDDVSLGRGGGSVRQVY